MVMHCVASKCNNLHDKRNKIQFHSFPFKRPDILKQWVEAIRRDNWEPTNSSKLCSSHFLESDYQDRPGANVKLLKLDAVPSIFNMPQHLIKEELSQNMPQHLIKEELSQNMPQHLIKEELSQNMPQHVIKEELNQESLKHCLENSVDIDDEPPMILIKTENYVEEPTTIIKYVDAQTQTSLRLQVDRKWKKKVKALREKVRRRDIKMSSMSKLLEKIYDARHSTENLRSVLENLCSSCYKLSTPDGSTKLSTI